MLWCGHVEAFEYALTQVNQDKQKVTRKVQSHKEKV